MNGDRNKIILAVAVSTLLHAGFFTASGRITLPGMGALGDVTRKIFRVKEVDRTPSEIDLFDVPETAIRFPDKAERIPLMDRMILEREVEMAIEREDLSLRRKQEKIDLLKEQDVPDPARDEIKPEALLKAEEKRIRREASPEQRVLAQMVLSRGPSSFSEAPRVVSDSETVSARYSLSAVRLAEGPLSHIREAALAPDEREEAALKGVHREGEYADASPYLEVDLKTFNDPATGGRYFMLKISVKEGARIEIMPKEMVFLLDSSRSLTEQRFEHVQGGVVRAIRSLDERDTFNVIAFKHEQERFRDLPVRATPANIRAGINFVNSLTADGMTDIENALLSIVNEDPAMAPSYIVLISDGMPTAGVTDPREIIRTITRINRGRRPIFSFGVGLRVNTYLLDFISYQNRAWSEFALARDSAGRDFGRFYDDIRDPILTNVRYRMVGIDPAEVFPGELPDFYHNRPFVIYGKYRDEDAFSMQILGDIEGTTKELIFQKKLSEAEQGGEDIPVSWAFNKAYHLIGLDTMGIGDGDTLNREIERLCRHYGITVPRAEDYPGE